MRINYHAKHSIYVGGDRVKFSCGHMTIFPDGTKEKLHGHNFNVGVAIFLRDIEPESFLDLKIVRKHINAQCDAWDERVLLPGKSPYFEVVKENGAEVELLLCRKRYVFPSDEVILLPVTNVIVETLAVEFGQSLIASLGPILRRDVVDGVDVTVSEAPGQGGLYHWDWNSSNSVKG